MTRKQEDKETIKKQTVKLFKYDLNYKLNDIRRFYRYDISCQGTVSEAITAFMESTSFEDAIRNAVSLGGDADTLACITGGISHAHYGSLPETITGKIKELLTEDLLEITVDFCSRYKIDL